MNNTDGDLHPKRVLGKRNRKRKFTGNRFTSPKISPAEGGLNHSVSGKKLGAFYEEINNEIDNGSKRY